MPVINLVTLQDILGGAELVNAIVTATVYRGDIQAIRIKDDEVVFPDDVRIKIVNGTPVEPLVLEYLDADCYYKIDIFVSGTQPYRANVVLPGGDGPFDIADLTVVDPSTYLPISGTTLADAFIEQVTALRDGMIVGGEVVEDDLILLTVDGSTINAGNVRGPIGLQGEQGLQGPQGEQGPQGLKGDEGDTQTIAYTHNQSSVSNMWVINHGLSFQPSVQVVDSSGSTVEGVVNYNSSSQLTIEFSVALSGTAYLS